MNSIYDIAKKINNYGGTLYIVGGFVRDYFLKISSHDKDFCITNFSIKKFQKLFPDAILVGKSFPVFILNGNEYALARTENKIGIKHTDFTFNIENIPIEKDLKRRDFTINSIAINILTKEIIDPFNGIKDIKNRILKMTSSAFNEDPLRVYRAARFSAQLNFKIEENTLITIKSMKKNLLNLSSERVFEEFRKALNSNNPENFFNILKISNCLDVHFKELDCTLFDDILNNFKIISNKTSNELLRFASLFTLFKKTPTFLKELKFPYNFIKIANFTIETFDNAINYDFLSNIDKLNFLEKLSNLKIVSYNDFELFINSLSENKVKFSNDAYTIIDNTHLTKKDLILLESSSSLEIKKYLQQKRLDLLNKKF